MRYHILILPTNYCCDHSCPMLILGLTKQVEMYPKQYIIWIDRLASSKGTFIYHLSFGWCSYFRVLLKDPPMEIFLEPGFELPTFQIVTQSLHHSASTFPWNQNKTKYWPSLKCYKLHCTNKIQPVYYKKHYYNGIKYQTINIIIVYKQNALISQQINQSISFLTTISNCVGEKTSTVHQFLQEETYCWSKRPETGRLL